MASRSAGRLAQWQLFPEVLVTAVWGQQPSEPGLQPPGLCSSSVGDDQVPFFIPHDCISKPAQSLTHVTAPWPPSGPCQVLLCSCARHWPGLRCTIDHKVCHAAFIMPCPALPCPAQPSPAHPRPGQPPPPHPTEKTWLVKTTPQNELP